MGNPAQGGAPYHAGWLNTPDDTRSTHDLQAAVRAIEAGLVCLPDQPSPGQHAADLAVILHCRLDPDARLWHAGAACLALDDDEFYNLMTAAQRDRKPPWPVTGRRHRPPPLTKADKRRMAQIPDFDDPDFEVKLGTGTTDRRARLASAWTAASDRDRRDLVNRATGRAS